MFVICTYPHTPHHTYHLVVRNLKNGYTSFIYKALIKKKKYPDQKQPKGERVHFSSQLRLTFHHFGSQSQQKGTQPKTLITKHPQPRAKIE